MNRPAHAAGGYVFGSSAAEITRLNELAELLQPSTRQVLREAGITDGMTVLDIGCGPGSVAFLNAELVGRAGSVTGIDRDPAMLATARAHALSSGQPVSFIQADLARTRRRPADPAAPRRSRRSAPQAGAAPAPRWRGGVPGT